VNQVATTPVTVTVASAVTATATATPTVVAWGGTSTLTAIPSGGLGPYTYRWNTVPIKTTSTITEVINATRTYTVTVTDALGQTADANATVTLAPALNVSAGANPAMIAAGGSALLTATVTGGVGPYQYFWGPGQTTANLTVSPTKTTTYTVTASDSLGQASSASVTVTVASGVLVNAEANPSILPPGGQATSTLTATGSGGKPPYTYQWTPWNPADPNASITVSPTTTTTYTVKAIDSLGQQSPEGSVTVTVASPLAVAVEAEPNAVVAGRTSTLTARPTGGLPPYTHAWSNGMTGTAILVAPPVTTPYTVTTTDALGQTAQGRATVTVVTGVSVTAQANPSTVTGGGTTTLTAVVTGGVPPYSYSWNTVPVQKAASIVVTPPGTRTYTVTVTDSAGQTAQGTVQITVQNRYPLTITTLGQGTVDPTEETYPEGSWVTLTARPADGWRFAFWGGDLGPSDTPGANPITILMNSAKTLTAVFVVRQTTTEPNEPTPPGLLPGCGATVGAAQLGSFWAATGMGVWGLSRWFRRRRRIS